MTDEQAQVVLQRICATHYVSMDRLLGQARDKFVFAARQAAARELSKLGFDSVQIGRYLNRHQSTVLNMLGTLAKSKRRASCGNV